MSLALAGPEAHAVLPETELNVHTLAGSQQRACAQDVILRRGRQHPLFARVAEARAPPAWVMAAQPERGMQARPAGSATGFVGCDLIKQRFSERITKGKRLRCCCFLVCTFLTIDQDLTAYVSNWHCACHLAKGMKHITASLASSACR